MYDTWQNIIEVIESVFFLQVVLEVIGVKKEIERHVDVCSF
jgi:hypothetical protein